MTLLLLETYFRHFFLDAEGLHRVLRRRLLQLFTILQSPIVVQGHCPSPGEGPFIFMANHTSLIDVPLLKAAIPGSFRGILSDHQFRWPLYGAVLRCLGELAIPRQDFRGSLVAYKRAERLLSKEGLSIVVLPEGGRSLTGRLLRFKSLPFQFAAQCGVPIIPVYLSGPFQFKNKSSWHIQPQRMDVYFDDPIPTRDRDPRDLRDGVARRFNQLEGQFLDGHSDPLA